MAVFAHEYRPHWLHRNQHLSTILPAKLRRVRDVNYTRERVDTPDGDFLDLDFSRIESKTMLIAIHGLEGCSDSTYIRGLVRCANAQGWDALAVNLRSCSGEPNRLYTTYHSGMTQDFQPILDHIEATGEYDHILIAGFSLGGNLSLKYAGEKGHHLPEKIRAVAAISVPTHLVSSAHHLARLTNKAYLRHFLVTLKAKAIAKKKRFPEAPFEIKDIRKARNFVDFDNLYTAPAHGFKDAHDYWTQCASGQFIPGIQVPTLILNALNDPFLPHPCYPYAESEANPNVSLETPKYGGHVGFATDLRMRAPFWHEQRILNHFERVLA